LAGGVLLAAEMLARAASWFLQFAVLLGIWLLFVSKLEPSETLVGVGAAVLSATASEIVRGVERPRFLPHIGWMLEFWRIPLQILKDCGLVTAKLFRILTGRGRGTGHFVSVPFEWGGTDQRSVARRVLAILYTTVTPNTIVVGIDRERNEMLLHTLVESPVPPVAIVMESKR
jgi:multisubunit Na+/H+ antiporter MnhE subunit